MTATWAWLVLLFPLLGSMTIGLTFRVLPERTEEQGGRWQDGGQHDVQRRQPERRGR